MTEEYKRAFLDTARTEQYATDLALRLASTWTSTAVAELGGFDEVLEKNLAQLDELQVLLDTVRGSPAMAGRGRPEAGSVA